MTSQSQLSQADRAKAPRKLWPLLSLNFFMADFQAGIGPFLGVFLLTHGWQSGWVGTVMTIGGVAGMAMSIPAGALVDQTTAKRFAVIAAGVATIATSALVLVSQSFGVMGAFALVSIGLWLASAGVVKPACAKPKSAAA
jgi:predicted MFS family arabinose efflux permease